MPWKPPNRKRPWVPERKAFQRPKSFYSFYNSWKWRKVSKAYRSAHPICECNECKELNRVRPAEVADHVDGLENILKAGRDPYSWDELQSMSHQCHNKKSGAEAGRLKGGMGKNFRDN